MEKDSKKRNTKDFLCYEKGITRLTVLLLIIALLMLAVALSFVLYNKPQQSSQVANSTENETKSEETKVSNSSKNEIQKDIEEEEKNDKEKNTVTKKTDNTSKNETSKSSKKSTSKRDWTQNKTEVTNEDVTLEVGSEVTGYESNGIDEWYVLGVEDGKLLITTDKNDEEVELSGRDGYENGIEILNNAVQDYKDGDLAESVRAINVDDINRVTGFNPEEDAYYGKEYTYVDKGTFYDGEKWVTLDEGESIKLKNTSYEYHLKPKNESDIRAYKLLTGKYYWIASTYVACGINNVVGFGMRHLFLGSVKGGNGYLYGSREHEKSLQYCVLPVVILKSDVKINSDGEISK